ncbi:hypothetical protein EGW08_017807 [Elysia chlorotica]|uniref:Uncharacterized protein n=1 Tax=Elysia chlorotica TaxID=188477 RepID=A0A433SYR2_ELYCH|nr:hypothetical protein EGW08_017807 [Elysia chlorotica]
MSSMKASKRKATDSDNDEGPKSKKAPLCLTTNARLAKAADCGDIMVVRNILQKKDQKLSSSCLSVTLLKAVKEGKKQIVQLLLNHAECVRLDSETGAKALISAAKHGYLDIVKILIRKGAPVDGQDATGKTALMAAVENSCCFDLVLYLLRICQADINRQDSQGRTALMMAVDHWDYETVQMFFTGRHDEARFSCDEGIQDKAGHTAHDLALKNGSADLLNVLSEGRRKRMSPLSVAAGRNDFDLVRKLVEVYPACVKPLIFGEAPLTAAMHGLDGDSKVWDGKIHCSLELMDYLLKAGVCVDKPHQCGHTPLIFAASAGSEQAVKMILSRKPLLNIESYEGTLLVTALKAAARKGWTGIVELLIEAGAQLLEYYEKATALHLAIAGGHRTCVQVLLKHWPTLSDADIRLLDQHAMLDILMEVKDRWHELMKDLSVRQSLLCKAVQVRSYELVAALVGQGALVNWCCKASQNLCPLFMALDDSRMLKVLLDLGADINICVHPSGHTPLMHAAVKNDVPLVETLLSFNADKCVESKDHTALTLACQKNKIEVVTALLRHGVDVNQVTQSKQSALWCSLQAKNLALTELLIKHGADVNFAGAGMVTILMQALRHCPAEFAELILRTGAEVNDEDENGDTALFHALRAHTLFKGEKVSLLLQYGANVNHNNLSLRSPLMVAAGLDRNLYVFKVLLASQPQVNAQDVDGETALHIAVQRCDEKKLKMLVSSGAEMNIHDRDYRQPLMVAFKDLNWRIMKALLSLGASTNYQRCESVRRKWKSDLDSQLQTFCTYDPSYERSVAFNKCVQVLLKAGCSLREADSYILDKFLGTCINEGESKTVRMLVQSGLGPNPLDLSCLPETFLKKFIMDAVSVNNFKVSPLCTAILVRRRKIVAMLARACFYHQGDAKVLQNPKMKEKLDDLFLAGPQANPSLLQELCPKNWSLRTWSKLAVQRAVGFGQGREDRVRTLPIPHRLQDELLFKNISVAKT